MANTGGRGECDLEESICGTDGNEATGEEACNPDAKEAAPAQQIFSRRMLLAWRTSAEEAQDQRGGL